MTRETHADVAVLGLGGIGSATALELTRRGRTVVGIEAHGIAHDRGSSHGESRLFRVAHERPFRRALARQAWVGWSRLQHDAGTRLLAPDGQLVVTTPQAMRSLLDACEDLDEPLRSMDEAAVRSLGLALPPGADAVLDPSGAVLAVERCIEAQCRLASTGGASLWPHTNVDEVTGEPGRWRLATSRGTVFATQLVVTCGAWMRRLLPEAELAVYRVPQLWFRVVGPRPPVSFVYDLPGGDFYGASWDPSVCKVGGPRADQLVDPDERGDDVGDASASAVAQFVGRCVPALGARPIRSRWCMSTASRDEDFIVDRTADGVVIAAGLSGQGYKYAPALASELADLLDGASPSPPHRFSRFGAGPLPAIVPRLGSPPRSIEHPNRRDIMSTARRDFETTIPAGMEQHADLIRKVDATIEIVVEGDGGGTWTIQMRPDMSLQEGPTDDPDGRFTFSSEAWQTFIDDPNTVTPLFLGGKLRVDGNHLFGLKLQHLVPSRA